LNYLERAPRGERSTAKRRREVWAIPPFGGRKGKRKREKTDVFYHPQEPRGEGLKKRGKDKPISPSAKKKKKKRKGTRPQS